ncbi:unnamed protein product, partial [Laminaria digitata]
FNIKGDAKFDDLRAESGSAIYNAAGAQFRFKSGATALFTDCSAFDGIGGALYNLGLFTFSARAVFVNTNAPSVYVGSTGRTVLRETCPMAPAKTPQIRRFSFTLEANSTFPARFVR